MKNKISILSDPKIFVFTIIWMMVLIFIGTIAQKDLGLYQAQSRYFSSWIIWFFFIPFPGGRLTLLIMFFNMLFLLLRPSFWSMKKIGVATTHLGVILLLLGGGVTAWFSSEGNMVIEEGKSSNFIVDSYEKELIIVDMKNSSFDQVTSISSRLLEKKELIQSDVIPFDVKIIHYYKNCKPIKRSNAASNKEKGFAKNFILFSLEDEKEIEFNRSGITFEIISSDSTANGLYSLFIGQQVPTKITINNNELTFILRRMRTYLPFELKLKDFKKELHPGTEIPKSFSSDLILRDKEISRPVLIEMNKPLRYKNYTFYQSSFNEGPNVDATILAVVKNYGRLFPYISSLVIALGLLLHILLKLPILFNKGKKIS